MRKILKISELEILRKYIGSDCFARLHANRHMYCMLESGAHLLSFYFCNIHNVAQKDERVCIYCNSEELIYVSDSKQCTQIAEGIDEGLGSYRQLLEFFITLTADDIYELEKMENKITNIEDGLLTKKKNADDGPAKIIAMRRELLKMKRYYEQLSIVTSELLEDNRDAFPDLLKRRFALVDRRMDHLLNSVLHLREYVTQVREAYQAQIDIEQNQIMKVFTVISAIFLPLTLIVGWYGMNMKMPEYGWQFGYLYVIALSVIVFAVCIALFKFKKWY